MNESRPVSASGSEPQNQWMKRRTRKILIIWCVSVGIVFVLFASLLFILAKAQHRAQSASCFNNIRQIHLSALLWAQDHNKVFPYSFLSMSNEMVTPKILVLSCRSQQVAGTRLVSVQCGQESFLRVRRARRQGIKFVYSGRFSMPHSQTPWSGGWQRPPGTTLVVAGADAYSGKRQEVFNQSDK